MKPEATNFLTGRVSVAICPVCTLAQRPYLLVSMLASFVGLSVRSNPSLERTLSGMPRKPAVLQSSYRRTSGLRGTPARSAHLER